MSELYSRVASDYDSINHAVITKYEVDKAINHLKSIKYNDNCGSDHFIPCTH